MSLPTYEEHCSPQNTNRKPFLETYLEAKGYGKKEETFHTLAFLTFNLVNANFRLADISVYPQSLNAITAQEQEITGWQAKLDRFMKGRHHILSASSGFQADFAEMATNSRISSQEDRDFVALAEAGRIAEIPPEASVPFIPSWQRLDQGNEFDSGFNRRSK